MTTVDEYITSAKTVLRKMNHLEEDFNKVDSSLREEWANQLEWLIWNLLTFLMKCTTKRQALQVTACSKRFHKHKVLLEGLGVNFP